MAKCERRFLATMLEPGVWMREATRLVWKSVVAASACLARRVMHRAPTRLARLSRLGGGKMPISSNEHALPSPYFELRMTLGSTWDIGEQQVTKQQQPESGASVDKQRKTQKARPIRARGIQGARRARLETLSSSRDTCGVPSAVRVCGRWGGWLLCRRGREMG
uniref:Uncharacterized protein n=1 Tax=Coccidioides posadasii RMSCC 3488 TaxID=454284 RepID=A0A0J6FC29_COCPO|nr:hypothetical protein CPAG_02838 [Coccidioides posadasii RMSCC 3488]